MPGLPIAAAVRWGDLLLTSGLAPIDLATGAVLGTDTAEQARNVLDQLAVLLDNQGSSLSHVLRIECFLAESADFGAWNTAFADAFPCSPPARTTIHANFPIAGLLIEIQAIAGLAPHT